MKKLLYTLFLLPLLFSGACSDDDDLPEVNVEVTFDNVVASGNSLYIVKDTPFTITSISAKGIGSKALVTSASYYWDNFRIGWNAVAPFGVEFNPALSTVGDHLLGISAEIAQEGKSLGVTAVTATVKVVETEEDLPDGAEPGQITINFGE